MGITIILPPSSPIPWQVTPTFVEVRKTWQDDWEIRPDLRFISGSSHVSGQDLDRCVITKMYGDAKQVYESDFPSEPVDAEDLSRYWVRVQVAREQDTELLWIGRISGKVSELYGSEDIPSGQQQWVAYGPLHELQRLTISESYWYTPDQQGDLELRRIGWVPSMNHWDKERTLIGNRSAVVGPYGTYEHGGTDVWTHLDYLRYLKTWFMPDYWSISGQTRILDRLKSGIELRATQTVADVIAKLINPKDGLDYRIRYRPARMDDEGEVIEPDGFAISVFSIVTEDQTFKGTQIDRNANEIWVRMGERQEIKRCEIEQTHDHQYDRIRVLGGRIIVCLSLRAVGEVPEGTPAGLVRRWTDEQGAAYLAATDEQRRGDGFRDVSQTFSAPDDWDWNGGSAAIALDGENNIIYGQVADRQTTVRRTLSWLPLREGWDYSTDPPTAKTQVGAVADFRPPAVWFWDVPYSAGEDEDEPGRYLLAEHIGVSVSVLRTDWGVHLECDPNHWIAVNHWDDAAPTETEPGYDYDRMIATVAIETDQRFRLEWTRDGVSDLEAQQSVHEIELPEAQFWYLAPGTVVDLDDFMWPYVSEGQILRDDSDRLAAVMAGAIARYGQMRVRATIEVRGIIAWPALLGMLLGTIEEGEGRKHDVKSIVTSLDWSTEGEPTTIIRTGYAK